MQSKSRHIDQFMKTLRAARRVSTPVLAIRSADPSLAIARVQEALGKSTPVERHRFLRELFALSCRMTRSIFIQTIERALRHQITDVDTLQRIARLCLSQDDHPLPGVVVDESFRQRAAYQQGHLTDAPDFTPYDKMLNNNEHDDG